MQEAHETADLIEELEALAKDVERYGHGQVSTEQRNDLRSLHHDIRSHIVGLDQYTDYVSSVNRAFWLAPWDMDEFAEMIVDWQEELGIILARVRKT